MYAQVSKQKPIVQKYGGTSVGTPERIQAVAKRLARYHAQGFEKLAVVVSAMSGETNRLVDLVKSVNPRASGKSYDMAVASGEQVSVALMGAALEAEGLSPELFLSFQLGIRTDGSHAKARIRSIDRAPLENAWAEKKIVVVAGFQGISEDFAITTLGRGGSDTSAVALAIAIDASFCEINTDVDGVFTCDPRLVPSAKLIARMDYESALEMASLGSKVLHPRCVELGAKYQMPITVRNTFSPDDHQRTVIMKDFGIDLEAPLVSGVTLDKDVARLTVSTNKTGQSRDALLSAVFDRLGTANVNVDIIVQNQNAEKSDAQFAFGFTVGRSELQKAWLALEPLQKEIGISVQSETNLVKVSVVGVGMRSHSGVASRTFSALAKNQIQVQMVSTSEIKISCVIPEDSGAKACQALHQEFLD